jgi:malate dehydrogenase (oxaloacetate-decarboxylating)(NADP+)
VFHDDQHGTAIIVSAAVKNALSLTGKSIEDIKIDVEHVDAGEFAAKPLR